MDDRDIWRAANILIQKHGPDAVFHASQRADELLERGDMDGRAAWARRQGHPAHADATEEGAILHQNPRGMPGCVAVRGDQAYEGSCRPLIETERQLSE
jgi:hypothetical protein